ncbi:MAG TPA: hypothetical protein VGI52_07885 [Solirubrobacteraceae bacterium]|jgi:hypothetical protein
MEQLEDPQWKGGCAMRDGRAERWAGCVREQQLVFLEQFVEHVCFDACSERAGRRQAGGDDWRQELR